MKKFVLVDSWGTWDCVSGCIDCTVKGYAKVAESNNRLELHLPERIEYRPDGTWHSFHIEKRAHAKNLGLA